MLHNQTTQVTKGAVEGLLAKGSDLLLHRTVHSVAAFLFGKKKNQVSCNPNTSMITRNLKYVYVGPAMSWQLVQAGPHFWPEGTWEKASPSPPSISKPMGADLTLVPYTTQNMRRVYEQHQRMLSAFFWLYLCDVCSIYRCAYRMIVLGQALVRSPVFRLHILGVLTSYFGKFDIFVCVRLPHDSVSL